MCSIGDEIKDILKKFRFRKATNNAAIICLIHHLTRPLTVPVKVDMPTMSVVLEEELEDISIDDIATEYLPGNY